ncbi:MAG TPA: signal peptide peptidase SppA [Longimicrobiales bacterium]|nr:signal peptide peptidase SppA [Longimicrobiales bacterium]
MVLTGVILAIRGGDGLRLGDRIALIEIDGVIADDRDLLEQLEEYRDDASVKGFVVAINSPGGVVGPSQSIYRELRRLRDEGKPVIASIGGVGASGGYLVALAADSILVLPGTMTGSIGVIMELPNAAELMDRVGVQVEVVKSSEHKDIGSPFRPMGEGDRALLDTLIQDVYGQFVETVMEERGLSRGQVLAVADGRVISGRQAAALGLVDGIGNLTDAVAIAGRMAGLGSEPSLLRRKDDAPTLMDVLLARTPLGRLRELAPLGVGDATPSLKYVVPW